MRFKVRCEPLSDLLTVAIIDLILGNSSKLARFSEGQLNRVLIKFEMVVLSKIKNKN